MKLYIKDDFTDTGDLNDISGPLERYTISEIRDQANELLDHPEQLQALLIQVTDKMKTVPVLGTVVSELPAMVSLVKSYVTKEYPDVSPKVIAAAVSGFIYLIKKKDLHT